jgi:hypothetical protein
MAERGNSYRGTRPVERLAWRLRCLADRIDRKHAPRATGYGFRWSAAEARYIMTADRSGCPIWFYDGDYGKAWEDAS